MLRKVPVTVPFAPDPTKMISGWTGSMNIPVSQLPTSEIIIQLAPPSVLL